MLIKLNKKQEKILYALTFVALAIGVLFLQTYLMLVVFSAIMAVLFNPAYNYIIRRGKSKSTASVYTFIFSMSVVIVPLIFVLFITALQISGLISSLQSQEYSVNTTDLLNSIINTFNNFLSSVGVSAQITIESVTTTLTDALSSISKSVVENIISAFTGVFSLITAAIIYIYVFLSMLKNQNKIKDLIRKLNPLGDNVSTLYLDRADAMTKATVRGQFIIAFMQGIVSAAFLAIAGMSNLFFFFTLLLTVMSVIPLGAGVITIPIGVIMILTGNIWQGVLVIANHLLIVTNIDNVMRPRLVPKSARLDPALMILSVFSGIALFGFLGIVIGPIIMILIVTTVQIYLEVFFKQESIDRTKQLDKKQFFKITEATKKATDKITSILD
jgi:predicted PurR-regulated permease PerM